MTGRLTVVGIGPGNPRQLTAEAAETISLASDLFGYGPYLDRLTTNPEQKIHASDNREEIARAKSALALAADGKNVAVVSGGDPGVFAMAAAICEAVEHGPENWRRLEIEIIPGITAMLAVAARSGAPLGHDFCTISLSDNLKPWHLIAKRLEAAARAGFVIALYNPISRARPWQLGEAFGILSGILPPSTPVIFGRAAGRPDESMTVVTMNQADPALADMATCIIVGSPETRFVKRPDAAPLVYTPRFSAEAAR